MYLLRVVFAIFWQDAETPYKIVRSRPNLVCTLKFVFVRLNLIDFHSVLIIFIYFLLSLSIIWLFMILNVTKTVI
jgi:hypothetical protein